MTQEVIDFYHFDSLWRIMKGEEKRGKLRADFYSSEVKEISVDLKSLRFNYALVQRRSVGRSNWTFRTGKTKWMRGKRRS